MGIRYSIALVFIFMVFQTDLVFASNFPVTARFFIGQTKVDPVNLNTEMTAQSLKKIDAVSQLGLEATYSVFKYLDFGIRYTKRYVNQDELTNNPATDYHGQIDQDSVLLLARVPFFRTNIVRADIFGGVGGSNTTFKIKTATQDGELTRRESNDWFATPYASFGASVGIGYKKFFLVAEGGLETNKVNKFKRTGTVNTNIDNIDLSGSYFTIGLMFDGLSASKKD